METALGRFPFVSRLDIVRAYKPGVAPSESTFRTLRGHRFVSGGASIRLHRHGRVSGQLRCYSALNLDAVVLARRGDRKAAEDLAAEAEQFEERWSPTLAALATDLEIADFHDLVSARNQLAHGLSPASVDLEAVRKGFSQLLDPALREQFVRVSEVTAQWATLDVLTPAISASIAQLHSEQLRTFNDAIEQIYEPLRQSLADVVEPLQAAVAQLAVDSILPLNAGLGIGDLALLRVEHAEGGSFVSLLAAVADSIEDADLDPATSAYFSDEPLPPAVLADVEARRSEGETVVVPPRVVALAS